MEAIAGACKQTCSFPDVISMLDVDDTESGTDKPDVSDSDNKDVAMDEPPKTPMNEQPEANMDEPPEKTPSYEPYEAPIEEHTITKGPMSKKRRSAMPTAREWVEILDTKNDKSPTLLEFNPIRSGGGALKAPPLRFFALTHLILELHYCVLVTFPKK